MHGGSDDSAISPRRRFAVVVVLAGLCWGMVGGLFEAGMMMAHGI